MSYATPAQMLQRKDARTLGDLVADDDRQVDATDLLTDANLQAALDDASGDIEAALLVGGKFTPAQLAALTGNSQKHLIRICCEVAMFHLLNRRPSSNPEQWETYQKIRESTLDPLRKGINVFNIEANIEAGVVSQRVPTVTDYEELNLWRDRMTGFYPPRQQRRATN